MSDIKVETELFLELDKEYFQKEETFFASLTSQFSHGFEVCKKYEPIKRFFTSSILKFDGGESDFSILNELRGLPLSKPLSIYAEGLICKCKGHSHNSLFEIKFKQYANQCFEEIKTGDNFNRRNFRLFLNVDSVFFKEGFNAVFQDFLNSLSGPLNVFQIFLFSTFFDFYGKMSKENQSSFASTFLEKIKDPRDDLEFIDPVLSLIQKIIPVQKDKTKDEFKYAYAKIVNGLSTSNPHYEAFWMQEPYQTALTYLVEIKSPDIQLVDSITNKQRFANKKALESIKPQLIPLDPALAEDLKSKFTETETFIKGLTFPDSVYFFLSSLYPFFLKTLESMIEERKKDSLAGLFNEAYLNEDGELLNGRKLKPYEQFSLDAAEPISLLFDLTYINFIKCFFRANKDRLNIQTIHPFIENIVSTNPLIQESDRSEMTVIFDNLFLDKFGDKFTDLCAQLEKSLRYWLSEKGISTKKMKPDSNDEIGISDIFNHAEHNRYRDAIEEVIDEDYYFTLTWMLNDDFGWNLRNDAVHGKLTGEKKMRYSVLFASLQIFKLYLANWSSSNGTSK
jgi:hypothetical protein